MESALLAQCTREICELHDFFQGWFRGTLDDNEVNFQRFADVMDTQFTIVGPNGVLAARPALLEGLRAAYHKQPDIRIWTQNHRMLQQRGEFLLCTYEEWQETARATTARLSSVWFQQQDIAPQGLVWLHVHETWISLLGNG